VHGYYYNIIHIFKVNGFPSPDHPYIFNGDFTDKGPFSLECVLTLLLIKLQCDECIHLTRGNHELHHFYKKKLRDQVTSMYDEEVWQLVVGVLNELPIGIILDQRILVMHGGLARPDLQVEDMRKIERGTDPDRKTQDLLWARVKKEDGMTYKKGKGYSFGPNITEAFLQSNNLELIVRGHTYNPLGYYKSHGDRVITLHSAPGIYPEEFTNGIQYGAFMNVFDKRMQIEQFEEIQSSATPMMIDWQTL